nr:FecR domain-containing protein [uncultured Draconibacterium sp.]
MKRELLHKYLNNSCTPQEFGEFTAWVNNEALVDNKPGQEDWNTFTPSDKSADDKKYSHLLDKIHHGINLKERKAAKGKSISMAAVSKWFSRAAAILFLPLLGALIYFSSDHIMQPNLTAQVTVDTLEVIAPIGSRTVVQLTDGTEVSLNYGSSLKYPREFIGNTREIELVGEAYFDVAHNENKPFIVNAGNLDIKVLGTEFNVNAYPGDKNISTTLVEGKVALEENNQIGQVIALGTMIPGQHVKYDKQSGEIGSTVGNIDKYIAWKDGKLVFDNEPIAIVAKKLSRMYNVEIQVAEEIKDLTYTVTFVDEPLFFILDLMTETTPVKYSVSTRTKLPDGTYSKQKILIEKRQ